MPHPMGTGEVPENRCRQELRGPEQDKGRNTREKIMEKLKKQPLLVAKIHMAMEGKGTEH